MKNLKGILILSTVSILLGTLIAIPCGLGVGTLTAVGIGSVGSVCNYVFFSKPRNLKHKPETESKPFLNIATEEQQNQPATKVFEQMHKIDNKPTFKGDHKHHDNNSNNELSL